MLCITSEVYDAVNSSNVTLLALLDLSAAFDCVDHSILIRQLHDTFYIESMALSWLASFLSERTQYVSFNASASDVTTLDCGVAKGSELGPLMFVLFTADVTQIAAQFGVSVHCYADDIQLYMHCSISDVDDAVCRIIDCIASIDRWISSNRLKFNPDKTQFTWLGTWQQMRRFNPPSMRMPSGIIIEPTSVVRDLGVFLDSHLSMGSHVDRLVKTYVLQLQQLRALQHSLLSDAASILVHAFISSRLDN